MPQRTHDEHAGHAHTPANVDRAFALGITLNLGFVAVEAFYGWRVNSLALLADAGTWPACMDCMCGPW